MDGKNRRALGLRRLLVLWLIPAVFASGLAWAQKKPANKNRKAPAASASASAGPVSLADSLTGQVRVDYDAARLLYSDGDFAGALVKFKSAHEASRDPRLLWNMAACEKNLRHYAKVLHLLRSYISGGGALLTDQDRQEARDLISTIEAFTAALTLTVNQEGAEVFIDDELVGVTPLPGPVIVDIGVRKIRVTKAGFVDYQQSVPVGGSKEVALPVQLVKELHEGKLLVRTAPGATIYLDGKPMGKGSYQGTVSSGGHTLRVVADGMIPYQSEVVIQDNENRTVEVPLAPVPQPVVVARKEEKTGALHGFEVGLRSGYGFLVDPDRAIGSGRTPFVPLWLDIGYRVGRPTYLGLYLNYAAYDVTGTCGVDRHGPVATSPGDLQTRYSYTECWHAGAGLSLLFHTLPRTIVDPWFGFDSGVQISNRAFRSYDPLTNQYANDDDGGLAFAFGFNLGIDVHLWRGLGFGPFARSAMVVGNEPGGSEEEMSTQTPNDFGSAYSCPPNVRCSSNDERGGGPVPQLIFGLRSAYTF